MLETAVLTVLPGAVAFAAAMDLFTMKIPNRISVLLVLAFFPLALLAGLDGWVIADHVSAGVAMLVLGVLLFIPGWFGGGDAKLMAAIGLWIGPRTSSPTCLCGAGRRRSPRPSSRPARSAAALVLGQAWAVRLHRHDTGIPYGIALAAGALLVYPQTVWFASLVG